MEGQVGPTCHGDVPPWHRAAGGVVLTSWPSSSRRWHFAVGDSEDGPFWTAFLRSLKARGLTGTRLVISDAHAGLKAGIDAVLLGASWQGCRVHFMRNVLAGAQGQHRDGRGRDPHRPRTTGPRARARQLDVIATTLGGRSCRRDDAPRRPRRAPRLLRLPGRALDARTAQQGDRATHRRRRRLPNPAALLRLAGAVLVGAQDESQVVDRRYLSEGTVALLQAKPKTQHEVAQAALVLMIHPQARAELYHATGRHSAMSVASSKPRSASVRRSPSPLAGCS